MKLDRIIAVRNTKTIYRDGKLCYKVFNNEFSKTDILNEALNQARAEECGLNAPRIRGITSEDDKWAIISDYINGKTLDRLIAEHPEQTSEYLHLFVKLQCEIHKKRTAALPDLKDKLLKKTEISSLEPDIRLELISKIKQMPVSDTLCHGDFNLSNVIITPNGIPYILDWAHAARGYAAADAANSYIELLFERGRDNAAQYLDLFCATGGISPEAINAMLPVIAAAKLSKSNEEKRRILYSLIK